ncbi:MAG: vitamin K epoxide reductase family protein [Verrucomicrobiota bacterium]
MPLAYLSAAPRLWLVRSLSFLALSASLGLTLWKWMGPGSEVPGCGGPEGCGAVLESRWSQWFSVPVTLLAASLWLTVLILTLADVQRALGRTADQLLTAAGTLLMAGALWFGGLLIFVVKMRCPWCFALHVTGLVVGGLILFSTWRAERTGGRGLLAVAGQAGCAGLALLVLGQVFGKPPDTHLLTATLPEPTNGSLAPVSHAAAPTGSEEPGFSRDEDFPEISYLNGTLNYTLSEQPLIGSPHAPHILAEFYDYTCPTCRSLHGDLKKLLNSSPGEYAVILLPVPLSRNCNSHLPDGMADHPDSCELAGLALAFWRVAPGQFPAFHDFLMSTALPLTVETARNEARRLAPSVNLREKETGAWIAERIRANSTVWGRLSGENQKMPKLLLRDALILHGAPVSGERFLEIIKAAFPVAAPLPTIPVTLPRK